jgi:hypothetical protein
MALFIRRQSEKPGNHDANALMIVLKSVTVIPVLPDLSFNRR